MRKIAATLLLYVFLAFGNLAFAQEPDCDCKKSVLAIGYNNFGIGFGYKSFNSLPGCNTNRGLGIGIGGEDSRFQIGFGYDMGIVGFGYALKDPKKTSSGGFGLGYDYGKCL
jgi:hypothetical protein